MNAAAHINALKSTNVRIPISSIAAAGFIRLLGGGAPWVSTQLAQWLWNRPARHPRPRREAAIIDGGEPVRIPYGMNSIHAWSWGSGPVILLVHGWEGRGSQLGAFVDPLVRAGFRVVAFDAPAHGDSGGDQASLFTFVDAVHTVARAVGGVDTAIAHSMGGAAVLTALNSGLEMKRVVFLAPADASQAIGRFASTVGMPRVVQERLEEIVETRHGAPIDTIRGETLAAELDIPALVFHDETDRFVPFSDSVSISGAWPGAVLRPTQGLGHHRILRDPKVVAATVEFIAPGAEVQDAIAKLASDELGPFSITLEELMHDLNWGRDD